MRRFASIALVVAACFVQPAHASTIDEIVYVYQTMCVNSIGDPAKQQETINALEKKKTIVRIPDAEVKEMFRQDIQGWATQTSDKTKMILTYDPSGVCALRIEKADEQALKTAFKKQVDAVAKELEGTVQVPVKDRKQKSGSHFTYYEVKPEKSPIALGMGISTAREKKGNFQHLLTFNLAQAETKK